jgi:hypothetical protein
MAYPLSELRARTVLACIPLARGGMPAMVSSLAHLTARFPDLFEQAADLFEKDPAFRDLCTVHAICARGVKRSQASRSNGLGAEYAAQQERLEAELLRRLQ